MKSASLVYIDEYGLRGSNFYWHKHEAKGISKEEIVSAGLTSERVRVQQDIIEPLQNINAELKKHGFELYIKEGYRSEKLYRLIFDKRSEKFGKEETERLFNMETMPHATGTSVDATLWNPKKNAEVYLRDGNDGTDALFVDFYKNRTDAAGKHYHKLQTLLIETMRHHGFNLGTKKEYFHFDYTT